MRSAGPPVEIVERTQRYTIQQIRAMSAEEYAGNMKNPEFVRQLDMLFGLK
jgi:hypothetical protein